MLTVHQWRKVPTVGGTLLFTNERERHFLDVWIQAGRFHGTDKSRILDNAKLRTGPPEAIEAGVPFVCKHALHGADIRSSPQDPKRLYFRTDTQMNPKDKPVRTTPEEA